MELVFQTNGEAMEGTEGCVVLRIVCVEGFGIFDGGGEEDFVEAVCLMNVVSSLPMIYSLPLSKFPTV